MDELTKPINLMGISFPVFRLGSEKPTQEEGVTLYIRRYGDESIDYKIVDDLTVEGNNLATRRLNMLNQGIPLKKIGKAIFFLGDLVKDAKPSIWYVDSSGAVFQYRKSRMVELIFKKIDYVHKIPSGGAILEIKGIPSRFKCLFAPTASQQYAGILKDGMSYVLYGLYNEQYDDTRRKL